MAVTAKVLVQPTMLTASEANLYVVPSVTKAIVQKLTLANTDTVARTATIYFVPSGGSFSSTNAIVTAYPIPAGFTADLAAEIAGHVLEQGGTITAKASSASVVSIRVSGVEIV